MTTVFSHGAELELLRGDAEGIVVHDLADVAHAHRSTTFEGPQTADVAILQGTAGSRELHAQHRFRLLPNWPISAD